MVCSGVLSGLLLISLLSSGITHVEGEVNHKALKKIIKYIEENYQPDPHLNLIPQYSVAIRVPPEFCNSNTQEQIPGLPEKEKVVEILNQKDSKKYRVFVNNNLVAARRKESGSRSVHAERILLNEKMKIDNIQQTPMAHLIGNHRDDCVVFYTYNSPCFDDCLNLQKDAEEDERVRIQTERNRKKGRECEVKPAVYKCIIPPLERRFADHKGPKAFVFNKVYANDTDKQNRLNAMLPLAKLVPLYRCETGKDCINCFENNKVNNAC